MKIKKFFRILFIITFGLAFFWLVIMKIVARLAARAGKSSPCPVSFSGLVDNPIRRRYMRPVLDRLGIHPGDTVLELGPGPGVFTLPVAQRVGPRGRVIAVDIQPEMIARLEARLRWAGVTNVEAHTASAYELPIPDESIDRAFLITVLLEIPDPNRALKELQRVLKPGGVLSITEEFLDPDYPFAFETIRRVEDAGFRMTRRYGGFMAYTINFQKAEPLDPDVLDILACPTCHGELLLQAERESLRCPNCQRIYPVEHGIPHFIRTEELTGLNSRFARMYDSFAWFYRTFSFLAFAFIGMPEEIARREVTDRLDSQGGKVLEISIGPGVNLPYLVNRDDVGEIYGLDISLGALQRCRDYIARKGWNTRLFLGNGEELPFRDNSFEGVFHVGGINFFNDKKKAIDEMIRVAKPGARILICDENEKGAHGYELSIPGFKRNFQGKRELITAPVDLLPPGMQELRVFDVWKGWMYCIEFRKPGSVST